MQQQVRVCIIGCGFVGEHLLESFSKHYPILGVDVSVHRVAMLKGKYHHINQRGNRSIKFQSTYTKIEENNVFLVSVPTLVKDGDIDLTCLYEVKKELMNRVREGSLIVIESSVYVGATREIFSEFRARGIFVGFSPERVDPGRKVPTMEEIPKVISGLDAESLEVIKRVYTPVFNTVVPVSSCECAEMCKLYENCFRMINIAYVNEIADMCENHGINTGEMIKASSTKPFGFMPFYPGLGVGGHCIPVNPYYLFKNGKLPVLRASVNMMEARPKQKAEEIVQKYPSAENILICGVGFKRGESLTTNSPGYALYTELINRNKRVLAYDPIVEECYVKGDIEFLGPKDFNVESLSQFDLVIVNLQLDSNEQYIIKELQKTKREVISFN